MPVFVRRLRAEEARKFLEVHHAAVHGLASGHYPGEVLADWAPLPITESAVARFIENPDREIRLVAEVSGEIVGVGALVLMSELRACYVDPRWVRRGVGSAIVGEIECIAREFGAIHLEFDGSVNAEAFYLSLGYSVTARGQHTLRSGQAMACVKMRKSLDQMSSRTP